MTSDIVHEPSPNTSEEDALSQPLAQYASELLAALTAMTEEIERGTFAGEAYRDARKLLGRIAKASGGKSTEAASTPGGGATK